MPKMQICAEECSICHNEALLNHFPIYRHIKNQSENTFLVKTSFQWKTTRKNLFIEKTAPNMDTSIYVGSIHGLDISRPSFRLDRKKKFLFE